MTKAICMNRRDVLTGAILLSVGAPAAAAIGEDPIVAAVTDYKQAWNAYLNDEDEHRWRAKRETLLDWETPCTSMAGVAAALGVVLFELEIEENSDLAGPMIKAAIGHLNTTRNV